MHRVAEGFGNLLADIFAEADDVAGSTHLHNLAVVWHPVECGVYRQTALAEKRLDVEWHFHVGGIHVPILQDDGIEFEGLLYHNDFLTVCKLFQRRLRQPLHRPLIHRDGPDAAVDIQC